MSLIEGCVEGQLQEKKPQTKKGLGFSEKTTGALTGREPLHANISPSMLISRQPGALCRHDRRGGVLLRVLPRPVSTVRGDVSQSVSQRICKSHGRRRCPQCPWDPVGGTSPCVGPSGRPVSVHRYRRTCDGTGGFLVLLPDEHATFRGDHRGSGRVFSLPV